MMPGVGPPPLPQAPDQPPQWVIIPPPQPLPQPLPQQQPLPQFMPAPEQQPPQQQPSQLSMPQPVMQMQPQPQQQQPMMQIPQPQPIMQQPPQQQSQQLPPQPQPVVHMPQPAMYPHVPQTHDEVRTLWVGDLQYWMEESYIRNCFAHTGEMVSVKIIRNKQTMASEGYGFIEFSSHAAAERILQMYNGTPMPQTEQNFRLNWASFGAGERRMEGGSDLSIFVGDLAPDVTDFVLQDTFRSRYPSVKSAKVVMDSVTGRSKGYGFVRFGEESERTHAMSEMNGVYCSSRPMRISVATPKKALGLAQQYNAKGSTPYQGGAYGAASAQGFATDNDPNNTTVFVGGLDPNVTDQDLRQVFGQFGDLVSVKIPVGKGCGFVQFTHRSCAEESIQKLHGTVIGQQSVRLSWGRSPVNKQRQPGGWGQIQPDPNQWNQAYYGYGQGYEAYGYAPPPQDANAYAYGSYPGYGNYPQQGGGAF